MNTLYEDPTSGELEVLCLELLSRLGQDYAHVSQRKMINHAKKRIVVFYDQFGAKHKFKVVNKTDD